MILDATSSPHVLFLDNYYYHNIHSSKMERRLIITTSSILEFMRFGHSVLDIPVLGNTVVTAYTIPTDKHLSYHNIINIAVLFITEETTVLQL